MAVAAACLRYSLAYVAANARATVADRGEARGNVRIAVEALVGASGLLIVTGHGRQREVEAQLPTVRFDVGALVPKVQCYRR